jgi:hypothetical protein
VNPSPDKPASINLDGKNYPLSWGKLAKVRYASVPEPLRQLEYPASEAIILWAAMAAMPNPFLTWEHVAQHLTEENLPVVSATLAELFPKLTAEQEDQKKSS